MTMTDFTEFDFIHPLPAGPHEGEDETRQQGLETNASQEESHESWPIPVDGAELLDLLSREFRRFLFLPANSHPSPRAPPAASPVETPGAWNIRQLGEGFLRIKEPAHS